MTPTRRSSLDELVRVVSDLIDHVKVLVTAVDDLRCEVEWWARNLVDHSNRPGSVSHTWSSTQATTASGQRGDETDDESALADEEPNHSPKPPSLETVVKSPVAGQADDDGQLSGVDRLSRLERKLTIAPRGAWPSDWDDEEPPELPTDRVVCVAEEIWSAVLDFRPAHVVGMGCDCEPGAGAPYLFAWQDAEGLYLRELTHQEAVELQQACLAAQREAAPAQQASRSPPGQRVLWTE
jgi:hypothetical protein